MFQQGENYRGYLIESIFDTPFGKWGTSSNEEGERIYLQHVPLLKPPPQHLIRQYLLLDHPLIIPYLQVYQESDALVFIRPYILLESIHRIPNEEMVNRWFDHLLDLDTYLEIQPIPMKPVYHPENIGITDKGELRIFLCGNESYMSWNFSDRKTFQQSIIGGQTSKLERSQHASPPKPQVLISRRAAILGAVITGVFCFGLGSGLMKVLDTPEKPVTTQAERSKQETSNPTPKSSSDPISPTNSTPPTQEDIFHSEKVAKEFIASLDATTQPILKKKARFMTILPDMQAEQIENRPGKIAWEIKAEVYHSNGNMEGDMYQTTFRVVTVKENGIWQVEDIQVLDEKKE